MQNNSTTQLPAESYLSRTQESGASPLDVLLFLMRNKLILLGLPLAIGLLAFAGSQMLPDLYRSTVVLVASEKLPATLLKSISEGDPVRDAVIEKMKLQERYGLEPGKEVALRFKDRITTRSAPREPGVLSISAVDHDPQFAARLADAVARETIATAQRDMITPDSIALGKLQIRKQQADRDAALGATGLAQAGIPAWRDALSPGDAALLATIADLQAALNLQTAAVESKESSTMVLQLRLGTLQQQLTERSSARTALAPAALEAVKDQFYLEAMRKRLGAQIEIAQKNLATEINLAGPASVPLLKDSPKRSLFLLGGVFAGLLLAIAIALWRERGDRWRSAMRRSGASATA